MFCLILHRDCPSVCLIINTLSTKQLQQQKVDHSEGNVANKLSEKRNGVLHGILHNNSFKRSKGLGDGWILSEKDSQTVL